MQFEQLMGRYSRLRRELADAYMAIPWNVRWIDRLADELAATEREMASHRQVDEQGGDGSMGFLSGLMPAGNRDDRLQPVTAIPEEPEVPVSERC